MNHSVKEFRVDIKYNILGSISSPSTPCQGISLREDPWRDIGGPGMYPPVADLMYLSSDEWTIWSEELDLKFNSTGNALIKV